MLTASEPPEIPYSRGAYITPERFRVLNEVLKAENGDWREQPWNFIFGSNGADKIAGSFRSDVIRGQGGRDTILGSTGDDKIDGGGQGDVVDYRDTGLTIRRDVEMKLENHVLDAAKNVVKGALNVAKRDAASADAGTDFVMRARVILDDGSIVDPTAAPRRVKRADASLEGDVTLVAGSERVEIAIVHDAAVPTVAEAGIGVFNVELSAENATAATTHVIRVAGDATSDARNKNALWIDGKQLVGGATFVFDKQDMVRVGSVEQISDVVRPESEYVGFVSEVEFKVYLEEARAKLFQDAGALAETGNFFGVAMSLASASWDMSAYDSLRGAYASAYETRIYGVHGEQYSFSPEADGSGTLTITWRQPADAPAYRITIEGWRQGDFGIEVDQRGLRNALDSGTNNDGVNDRADSPTLSTDLLRDRLAGVGIVAPDAPAAAVASMDGSDPIAAASGAAEPGVSRRGNADANVLGGGAGDDFLRGDGGDDRLIGGEGADVYFFAAGDDSTPGDGADVILDADGGVIRFLEGVDLAAVTATLVDGADGYQDLLVAYGGDKGGTIRILAQGADVDRALWSLDVTTIQRGPERMFDGPIGPYSFVASAGRDYLTGTSAADVMAGGTGDDVLIGGAGNDVYLFHRGDGRDEVRDPVVSQEVNVVRFGPGIAPDEITVLQSEDGGSLILRIGDGADQVVLKDRLINALGSLNRIEFADGTVWTTREAYLRSLTPTGADQALYGDIFGNALAGGGGDDTLVGRTGDDTYRFERGDGRDVIRDRGRGSDYDVVALGAGIAQADVLVRTVGDGIELDLGAGDVIVLENRLLGAMHSADAVRLSDGSVWDYDAILARAGIEGLTLAGTDGADALAGGDLADVIEGLDGNDTIDGGSGSDTIRGGLGDDRITSSAGSDVFLYAAGDGDDRLDERSTNRHERDELRLIDLGPGGVRLERSGDDLLVRVLSTGDVIEVSNQFADATVPLGVERVSFADGTALDRDAIADAVRGDGLRTLRGTPGDDALAGGTGAERLIGGLGDDTLEGGAGSDIYVFARGDGRDVLRDAGAGGVETDVLEFGAGITEAGLSVTQARDGRDLVLTFTETTDRITLDGVLVDGGLDRVRFSDGVAWDYSALFSRSIAATAGADVFYGDGRANLLRGAEGDDVLTGRAGDDTLDGGAGIDTVRFAGDLSRYAFERIDASTVEVVDTNPAGEGRDVLINVESVSFADGLRDLASLVPAVNQSPVLVAPIPGQRIQEDSPWSFTVPAATFSDPEGRPLALSAALADGRPLPAWLAFDAVSRTLSGQPPRDFDGAVEIRITAADRASSVSATFQLLIDPVNDAPTLGPTLSDQRAVPGTVQTGALVGILQATDVDDTLTAASFRVSDDRFMVVAAPDAFELRTKPGSAFDHRTEPSVPVTVTLTDAGGLTDSQNFAVVVERVNAAPQVAAQPETASGVEDGVITGALLAGFDPDGDALSFRPVEGSAVNGAVSLDAATGAYAFRAARDYFGPASFRYVVADGSLASAEKMVSVTVTAVNDAPEGGVGLNGTAREDQRLSANTAALADVDGLGAFLFRWQRSRDGGVVWSDVGAGAADYLLGDADVGARLRVQVSYIDGAGTTEVVTGAASPVVAGVNDAPTGAVVLQGVAETGGVLTAGTSSLADADGLGTLRHQWQRSADSGATWTNVGLDQKTYALTAADAGARLRVTVSYTDGQGTAEALTSAMSAPVQRIIAGTTAADSLVGGAAADILRAYDGNDTLLGGAGADTLDGGNGTDSVHYTNATRGVVANFASPGLNTGDAAGDVYIGIENLVGSAYADSLTGNAWANVVRAGDGADTIAGGGGNDILVGGAGNDLLYGGEGSDRIYSEAGTDTISGGAGNDVFYFSPGQVNLDTISDFVSGQDTLIFSGFAANYSLHYIGPGSTSGLGTGSLAYAESTSGGMLPGPPSPYNFGIGVRYTDPWGSSLHTYESFIISGVTSLDQVTFYFA